MPGVSGRLGCTGQRLGVDVLPDLRQFAFSNSDVENPVVPERLIGGLDFSRGAADGQNPVSLCHEFGRLRVCHLHFFVSLPKRSCHAARFGGACRPAASPRLE